MVRAILPFLILLLSTVAFAQRGPTIPSSDEGEIVTVFCDYKAASGAPDFNWMDFVPIFENMYNTNQIDDPVLKEEIHCVLFDFYLQDDPYFAKDFSLTMPEADCR